MARLGLVIVNAREDWTQIFFRTCGMNQSVEICFKCLACSQILYFPFPVVNSSV